MRCIEPYTLDYGGLFRYGKPKKIVIDDYDRKFVIKADGKSGFAFKAIAGDFLWGQSSRDHLFMQRLLERGTVR